MEIFSRALALLLSILFLPIIIIISFFSMVFHGFPIIYQQDRYGYKFKVFKLYKFRTMVENSGKKITEIDDSRVTSFGKLLRISKLDELPQMYNIIKGDMRFIGPRPEVKEYFEKDNFDFLKMIKPGLSCFSSILFRNESKFLEMIDLKDPYPKILVVKLELARFYAKQKCFALDLKLVFYTILSILNSKQSSDFVIKDLPLDMLPETRRFFSEFKL